MKKVALIIAVIMVVLVLVGCTTATQEPAADTAGEAAAPAGEAGAKTFEDLTVGYAQIGAESEWRTANTASIKEEGEKLGVSLKFSDAQQKQENQIAAIRSYIAEDVDVIGFSPVVETGWETVLQEAKDAGIPVIMVDRRADVPRELYATYLGSDFVEEGKKAGDEMNNLLPEGGKLVELVGTVGSAPANDRHVSAKRLMTTLRLSIPNPVTSRGPRAKRSWKPS